MAVHTKQILLLLFVVFSFSCAFSQSNQWKWTSGDTLVPQYAVYGTKGLAALANKPGARQYATSWTDNTGNMWVFGGAGYATTNSGYLDDLWMYNPTTGLWTWISGDRYTDQTGSYGNRNVAGPNNKPGARQDAVGWTDAAGNCWLFGGIGYTSNALGNLNDLWKYSPALGQWTWVSGDNATYQAGVYGVRGLADSANKPGARVYATGSRDASGTHLWLFGGGGYASNASAFLNDLWQFTIPLTILPIQFNGFKAQREQQTVRLLWTTAREQNSRLFIVERSADGTRYDSIGYTAVRGTNSSGAYSFVDASPLPGVNFYRLQQKDNDGMFTYSSVQKVVMPADGMEFAIIQNPVQKNLSLRIYLPATQKVMLQIRDAQGNLVRSDEHTGIKGRSQQLLAVDQLAKGIYFISVQTANASSTKIFIKQ